MTHSFKGGLEEDFSPASELGSFPTFRKGAFKGHAHGRYPTIQISILALVIILPDSSGMKVVSF